MNKKQIIICGILIIVLINSVNARGGGAVYGCDIDFHNIWSSKFFFSNEDANIYALKLGYNFMVGCFTKGYNFGRVTYHEKPISGTHYY